LSKFPSLAVKGEGWKGEGWKGEGWKGEGWWEGKQGNGFLRNEPTKSRTKGL